MTSGHFDRDGQRMHDLVKQDTAAPSPGRTPADCASRYGDTPSTDLAARAEILNLRSGQHYLADDATAMRAEMAKLRDRCLGLEIALVLLGLIACAAFVVACIQ